MRAQFDRRLARIESLRKHDLRCAFNDDESSAINGIFRKHLGRDVTREDIRARNGVAYRITDEEEIVMFEAVTAAAKRGWLRKGAREAN
jgi:hypothetical protein